MIILHIFIHLCELMQLHNLYIEKYICICKYIHFSCHCCLNESTSLSHNYGITVSAMWSCEDAEVNSTKAVIFIEKLRMT